MWGGGIDRSNIKDTAATLFYGSEVIGKISIDDSYKAYSLHAGYNLPDIGGKLPVAVEFGYRKGNESLKYEGFGGSVKFKTKLKEYRISAIPQVATFGDFSFFVPITYAKQDVDIKDLGDSDEKLWLLGLGAEYNIDRFYIRGIVETAVAEEQHTSFRLGAGVRF